MDWRCLILVPMVFAFGCATGKDKTAEQLNLQVSELRKSIDETNSRLEDLTSKFQLLREKMEAAEDGGYGEPLAPPPGLKVVRLGEEEARKEGARAGKAADPKTLYSRGQDLLMSGRYNEARAAFQELLATGSAGGLSDNALYWIGESYYAEKEYLLALEKFKEVGDRYPDGNKAPDALLKAAYSYMEMKEGAKAEESLLALVERYPKSEAAVKAKAVLKKIGNK